MKTILSLLLLLTSISSFAMPFRCTSVELVNGAPIVNFKVNSPRQVLFEGKMEEKYVLGVTPVGIARYALYADGRASDSEISLNFVERGFLTGYLQVDDRGEGVLEGEFKHTAITNKILHVKCLKITDQEPSAPTGVEVRTKFEIVGFSIKKQN